MSNGQLINKDEAKILTDAYQSAHPNDVKAYYYDANLVQEVLDQANVAGLRLYFGTNSDGALCLVFVGVDDQNYDLVDGKILEMGTPCPTLCALNSFLST